MKKEHYISIAIAFLLLIVLYVGFDIKPSSQKALEKSRAANMEVTSIQNLILEARNELGPRFSAVEAINMELNSIENDSLKTSPLERLASTWYELGYPSISGYFAEEIAKIKGTEESWSMAGTTYLLGAKDAKDEKVKLWSGNRAALAFENAISLDPGNLSHKINLALGYVEIPPAENPMKGILMLRDLNKNNPDDIRVIMQLARLSIQTGQWENAIKRLKEAESLDGNNIKVLCMLAEVYKQTGNSLANQYAEKCIQ